MKKVVLLFLLLIPIVLAQPFGPPMFIGNPDTGECKYYFAGDPDHFNERPEGFPDNLGLTTDFEDQAQACAAYSCYLAGGGLDPSNNNCVCSNGQIYNNNTMESCPVQENPGIQPPQGNNEITGATTQETSSEGLRIDRILILIVAVALVAYFIYSRKEINKLKNQINKPKEVKEETSED